MQESWPACGGSTRVGTSPVPSDVEKSRSRAIGADHSTSLGVLQVGFRRSDIVVHQRIDSPISSTGVARRRSASAHQPATPSTAADQAVSASVKAISSYAGEVAVDI